MAEQEQRIVLGDETEKIANQTTDGLGDEVNSLSYRVAEIERHFHSRERWMGLATVPVGETHRADVDSMAPFVVTSGNDTYGAWLQILGSGDTPAVSGGVKFDLHDILITDVSTARIITRIQIAFGDTAAGALSAGDYTEFMIHPEKTTSESPFAIQMPRNNAGTKVWARVWADGETAHDVEFFYGFHEYEG